MIVICFNTLLWGLYILYTSVISYEFHTALMQIVQLWNEKGKAQMQPVQSLLMSGSNVAVVAWGRQDWWWLRGPWCTQGMLWGPIALSSSAQVQYPTSALLSFWIIELQLLILPNKILNCVFMLWCKYSHQKSWVAISNYFSEKCATDSILSRYYYVLTKETKYKKDRISCQCLHQF